MSLNARAQEGSTDMEGRKLVIDEIDGVDLERSPQLLCNFLPVPSTHEAKLAYLLGDVQTSYF